MKGEISICDNSFEIPFEFEADIDFFVLDICVSKDYNLDSLLNDKDTFIKLINKKLYENEITGFYDELAVKIGTRLKKEFDQLLDYVEYIRVYSTTKSIREMILENPIVLTKKIVIDNSYQITDYEDLKQIYKENEDIKDQLYIMLEGNSNYVLIDDAIKTIETIIDACKNIKHYNLSQLETIMLVYDYVRDRVYQSEDLEENYFSSRDLTSVLFGDKIVCCGFTHLFNSMLNYLNINYEEVPYSGQIIDGVAYPGHIRSLVYVNDDKYDIKGLYFFDPTWDCKKSCKDNNHLSRYKYFGKNLSYMDSKNEKNHLRRNHYFKYYDEKYFRTLYEALKNNDTKKLTVFIENLNHVARRVIKRNLIEPVWTFSNNIDEEKQSKVINGFVYILEYLKREIPAETMMQIVNNVRKIEYYNDPVKYPYSKKELFKIAYYSDWNFENPHMSFKDKVLLAIFDIPPENRKVEDDIVGYLEECEFERDINGVKLARTLRNVLSNKKRNN